MARLSSRCNGEDFYCFAYAINGRTTIDLPQAVDAVGNNEAASMLKRDVEKLAAYFWQFAPQILSRALESALGRPECTPLAGSRRSHGALRRHLVAARKIALTLPGQTRMQRRR
jgi:serine/threonine-protein kinase RIO1